MVDIRGIVRQIQFPRSGARGMIFENRLEITFLDEECRPARCSDLLNYGHTKQIFRRLAQSFSSLLSCISQR